MLLLRLGNPEFPPRFSDKDSEHFVCLLDVFNSYFVYSIKPTSSLLGTKLMLGGSYGDLVVSVVFLVIVLFIILSPLIHYLVPK